MIIADNITCVWYPSGGFGYFVNAVLSLYAKDFKRPNNTKYEISDNGHSHDVELVAPRYLKDPDDYRFDFVGNDRYTVLIDNGIDNESYKFFDIFPLATTIKITYDDLTWPVVARAMIDKAMESTLDQQIPVDLNSWPDAAVWAQREKYFLFLRDHPFRHKWRPDPRCSNLSIATLLDYTDFKKRLNDIGIQTHDFSSLHQTWQLKNSTYINPIVFAEEIMALIAVQEDKHISYITDIWTQAVINYYIWIHTGIEVPANDYSDWFTSIEDIVKMLDKEKKS